MKDFVEDIKAGFRDLPRFLPPVIILCWGAVVFGGGVNAALNILIVCLGVWAVIFIVFPFVVLILGTINRIFGLEETNKK